MSNYVPIYIAKVTEVESSSRRVKVANDFASADIGWVRPAFDGGIKADIIKDDLVMILNLSADNQSRYYLPVRQAFSNLSDSNSKVQLESRGDLEVDGTNIKIGSAATESAALGDTLVDILDQLLTALAAETHAGNLGIPTGPPLNVVSYTTIQSLLDTIKSLKVKVE